MQGLAKDRDLRVLTPEAENCGSGDVGMVDVAGDEAAEIIRIFAGASAATFVE
jgi:hypothetical protein